MERTTTSIPLPIHIKKAGTPTSTPPTTPALQIANPTLPPESTIPKPQEWTPAHLTAFVCAIKEDSSSSTPSLSSVPTTVDKDGQKLYNSHCVGIAEIPFKKLVTMCGRGDSCYLDLTSRQTAINS